MNGKEKRFHLFKPTIESILTFPPRWISEVIRELKPLFFFIYKWIRKQWDRISQQEGKNFPRYVFQRILCDVQIYVLSMPLQIWMERPEVSRMNVANERCVFGDTNLLTDCHLPSILIVLVYWPSDLSFAR